MIFSAPLTSAQWQLNVPFGCIHFLSFVMCAVSWDPVLEKACFWHRVKWRPWQQQARHVCHNQLLLLIPIYGHLGWVPVYQAKSSLPGSPTCYLVNKELHTYMGPSLWTIQRRFLCLSLALCISCFLDQAVETTHLESFFCLFADIKTQYNIIHILCFMIDVAFISVNL